MTRRAADVDHEYVRRLCAAERDAGCSEAPEIGRRVANEIARRVRGNEDQAGDEEGWPTLIGLCGRGAAEIAKSVLKENALRITRRGQTVSISGAYAIPGTVMEAPAEDGARDAEAPPARSTYVQFDFMTWPVFFMVRDELRGRRGSLDAVLTTFDEIAKLEASYPDSMVGEAMERAGFDLVSRRIDLDALDAAV